MVAKRRRGLTLLEVILVLGLATLILYAISMAIDFHLRTLDVRRSNVEEAQVARAVLNMIANDLRSTVREYRMDTSGIEQMLAGLGNSGVDTSSVGLGPGGDSGNGQGNSGSGNGPGNNGSDDDDDEGGNRNGGNGNGGNGNGGNGNGGNGMGGGNQGGNGNSGGNPGGNGGNQGSGSNGSGDPSMDEDGGTENTQNLASTTTLPPTPGLYGNQSQLQLDVSRLPRPDQYTMLQTPNQLSLPQIPSDVKTITYFVQDGVTAGSGVRDPFAFGKNEQPAVGLIRREVDRAVVQFAQTNGTSDALFRTGDLIAREVTAIQFQYFDGLEWLPQWDSAAKKGLPVAIEILVEITPSVRVTATTTNAATVAPDEPVLYRLVVQMPLGEPADLQSAEAEAGMENLGL